MIRVANSTLAVLLNWFASISEDKVDCRDDVEDQSLSQRMPAELSPQPLVELPRRSFPHFSIGQQATCIHLKSPYERCVLNMFEHAPVRRDFLYSQIPDVKKPSEPHSYETRMH